MMTTKPVWQTDADGYLIGMTVADASPLEPGVYLIPAGCVEVEPPADRGDGKEWRWNGAKWQCAAPRAAEPVVSPQDKLAAFLAANPDVKAMIDG